MEKNLFKNTILIVDDTPENIDVLTGLLEDFKKKVAINGEKALKIALTGNPPDLILLDIMMPEMDGYEVCRRLRADERTKDVPVIFLTAKTQKDDIVKGFEAGGQDYVTKPFDSRELMERVKTQLELKTQRVILENMNLVLEEKVQERTAQLQKAMENLDKANKELQGLDNAKNSFLQMISHEIRTPLNGIVGAAHLLKDSMDEDNEFYEFIDLLKISVDRLEVFSTTALVITQLQAGNYSITREPYKIDKVINDCVSQIDDFAKEQNVAIRKELVDQLLEIDIDVNLMKRVIVSLLHNAVKYSPDNDMVFIKAYEKDDKMICEIIDRGRGFTKEAMDNLFKPFGLGEDHYDENVGLSLRAAKMIIEAHNGEIHIKNLPHSGAMVKLVMFNKGKL